MQHTLGWPLGNGTGGGSFLYHFDDNLVAVGFVVHLNYRNPYLSPFEEFQRFKTHPLVRDTFAGGKRICYGARAITEGGLQSVPKLTFPGGALIGCAAGFVNVPRIKGSHNAMLSGMLAAEHVAAALAAGRAQRRTRRLRGGVAASPIGRDLWQVRNVKPLWSKLGTAGRHRARRLRHVDQHARLLAVRHARSRQARLRDARARGAMPAHRLCQARRQADLRPAVVGLSVEHQSRGGSAAASRGARHGAAEIRPSTTSMPGRRRAIVRPASTNGSRTAVSRVSSSTRRTASTAKPATSRIRTRTSPGCRPRAAAGRTIRTCDRAERRGDRARLPRFRRRSGLNRLPHRALRAPRITVSLRACDKKIILARRCIGRSILPVQRSELSAEPVRQWSPRDLFAAVPACRHWHRRLAFDCPGLPSALAAQAPARRSFCPRTPPAAISPRAMPAPSATPVRPRSLLPQCAEGRSAQSDLLSRTFLSVLTEGDIDEAAKLADRVLQADKTDRIARLVVGVRALKQKAFGSAKQNFTQSVRGPVTDLTAAMLAAWAQAGAGDSRGAIDTHGQAVGPGLVRHLQGSACRPDPRSRQQQKGSGQALRPRLQGRSDGGAHRGGLWPLPVPHRQQGRGAQGLSGFRQATAEPSAGARGDEGDQRRPEAAAAGRIPAGRRRRGALRARRLDRTPRRRGTCADLSAARALSRADAADGAAVARRSLRGAEEARSRDQGL